MGGCLIQVVIGAAGAGKSTYCHALQEHLGSLGPTSKRKVYVGNLDPAAESFKYEVAFDIRDLISVDEVMEELNLGPNGALMYCMEFLLENLDWLEDELDKFLDDDYLILDCPGQIELYTHVPIMKNVISRMKMWGYESYMIAVFILDATFVCDTSKFISGSLLTMSTMIQLELPHLNILSKCDLVKQETLEEILETQSATQLWDRTEANSMKEVDFCIQNSSMKEDVKERLHRRNRLTESICQVIDDYSMVSFIPLNIMDEDSLNVIVTTIDNVTNFAENLEVRAAEYDIGNQDEF